MSNTPNIDKILSDAIAATEIDSPEWEIASAACDELDRLKEHVEALKKSHEGTSKALYELQFVTHENLINKYCALRDAMKALVEGMGYTVKPK